MGASRSNDWVPRVGLNCATCHSGAYREAPGADPKIVLGMPAHQMDLQAYARFLSACAKDPRFNADTLIAAMQKHPEFGFFDGIAYRLFAIGATQKGIQERDPRIAWFDKRPPQGPGRVDTFNPYKAMFRPRRISTPIRPSAPPICRRSGISGCRRGLWLHWDGNNDSVEERNKSAAIGAGATPKSIDLAALDRIANWILDLKPPSYPPDRINAALANTGRPLYQQHCASCHDIGQPKVGQTIDIAEIGTDPERLNSFTPELAKMMNTIGTGKPWRFSHFRKTNGYAGMPLDGIWLRAPYLHNGSVPTLRALLLLDPRPATFYRAYDVYDFQNVGFVCRDRRPRSSASFSRRPSAATATVGTRTDNSCPSRIARRCSSTQDTVRICDEERELGHRRTARLSSLSAPRADQGKVCPMGRCDDAF